MANIPAHDNLHDMRVDYRKGALNESEAAADPIEQFARWFADAREAIDHDANAMTLATASADGTPDARIVLLKAFDKGGFTFFTNYDSQKGRELAENPRACLVFHWLPLERQVRIVGSVSKTSREEAKVYFDSRPRGSRIAASISRQSEPVPNRKVLEDFVADLSAKVGEDVPLPDFWGGYRVTPQKIEFWQGRPSRLHDRLLYTRVEKAWKLERLSP